MDQVKEESMAGNHDRRFSKMMLRWMTLGFLLFFSSTVIAVTMSLLGRTTTVRAGTICVKPGGGGGCLASIQAAVAMAGPTDVIRVATGTFVENVVISKTLTLQGGWAPDFSYRDLKVFTTTITPVDNTQSV